jgi:hypothetical protein
MMESATASNEDTTASSGGKQKQFPYQLLGFPYQLYNLLEIASEYSALAINGDIYPITWCEHGRAIRIINRNAFEKVLPLFFGATKYLSFEKQLYRWQFKRIKDGPNQGSWHHEHFIRGHPKCLDKMVLIKHKHAAACRSQTSPPPLGKKKDTVRVPTSKGRKASSAVAKSKDMNTYKKVSPEIRKTTTTAKKKSQSRAGVSSSVQLHRQADHASAALEQPTQTRRITIDAVHCHQDEGAAVSYSSNKQNQYPSGYGNTSDDTIRPPHIRSDNKLFNDELSFELNRRLDMDMDDDDEDCQDDEFCQFIDKSIHLVQ